eukprot:scaffold123217_cov49-Attheya_sp.AAC.7
MADGGTEDRLGVRSGCAGPTGAGSRRRREDRQKDAAGDAEGSKVGSEVERDCLTEGRGAARGIGRGVGEGQGAKEADRRVEEREDVSPGNVGSRVRGGSGVEENSVSKFNVIGSSSSEAMPEEPPTTRRVRKRSAFNNDFIVLQDLDIVFIEDGDAVIVTKLREGERMLRLTN